MPASLWPQVKEHLLADLKTMQMGTTEDFRNFINAVIDEKLSTKYHPIFRRLKNQTR
jgi:1-pyrroline-5-carboxylate dehydrogenase